MFCLKENNLVAPSCGGKSWNSRTEPIPFHGLFAENIAVCDRSKYSRLTDRKRTMLTLKKYYRWRTRTAHWNEIMDAINSVSQHRAADDEVLENPEKY